MTGYAEDLMSRAHRTDPAYSGYQMPANYDESQRGGFAMKMLSNGLDIAIRWSIAALEDQVTDLTYYARHPGETYAAPVREVTEVEGHYSEVDWEPSVIETETGSVDIGSVLPEAARRGARGKFRITVEFYEVDRAERVTE